MFKYTHTEFPETRNKLSDKIESTGLDILN